MNRLARPVAQFLGTYAKVFRQGMSLRDQRQRLGSVWISDVFAALCDAGVVMVLATGTSILGQLSKASATEQLGGAARQITHVAEQAGVTPITVAILAIILGSSSLIIAAVSFRFLAARKARQIARTYHQSVMAGLLDHAVTAKDLSGFQNVTSLGDYRLSCIQHAVQSGKAIENMSRMGQMILFLAVIYIVALYVNWQLTGAITLLALGFAPVVFIVGRRIHSYAGTFFRTGAAGLGGKVNDILMGAESGFHPNRESARPSDTFFDDPVVRNYFDGYDGVQLATARMGYMTGLVRAIVFGIGITMIAAWVMTQEADASKVVGFATALFIAFNYLQTLFANLATLNIYYPQVSAYQALRSALGISAPDKASLSGSSPEQAARGRHKAGNEVVVDAPEQVIFRANPQLPCEHDDLLTSVTVGLGGVVDLVCHARLSRFELPKWWQPLVEASSPSLMKEHMTFQSLRAFDISQLTQNQIDDGLLQTGNPTLADISRTLHVKNAGSVLPSAKPPVTHDPDPEAQTGPATATMTSAPSDAQAVLAIAYLLASGAKEVFIDQAVVRALPPQGREQLARLCERVRLYVVRSPMENLLVSPTVHLIIREMSLAAILPPVADAKTLAALCPNDAKPASQSAADDAGLELLI